MASVTEAGVVVTPVDQHLERNTERWREGFGDQMTDDPSTPQGQYIGLESAADEEVDQSIIAVEDSLSLNASTGSQVDALVSPWGTEREDGTHSTATVTFYGRHGTIVPAGTVVQSVDGDLFTTDTQVVIAAPLLPATSGLAAVQVTAVEEGPIAVDAQTIIILVEPPDGVRSVTNLADGILGTLGESDTALKRRHIRTVAKLSSNTIDAISSAFNASEYVVDVSVWDNDTAAQVNHFGLDVPANTLAVAVRWTVEAMGDQDLFEAVVSPVRLPGIPRLYKFAEPIDVTAVLTVSGVSVSGLEAAKTAVRNALKLRPGEIIKGGCDSPPDILFAAKLAVHELGEDSNNVDAVMVNVSGNRELAERYSSSEPQGVRFYEYINLTSVI